MATVSKMHRRYARLRNRFGSFYPVLMGFFAFIGLIFGGTLFYMRLEGWNFADSFYMVVITLSTVGFGEIHELTRAGRMFTSILILLGVGNFMFIAGSFSQLLVEGKVQEMLRRRSVRKSIDRLREHFIVCGYGRIGSVVAKELIGEDHDVVVIENDEGVIQRLDEEGLFFLEGDATDDSLLIEAGIMRARAVIAALSNDAANVFVTLTARQMNPGLQIISRANTENHVARIERAGADRVILPHRIGGLRMAQSVLRPTVTSVVEFATQGQLDIQMEELVVTPGSEVAGKNLIEAEIRSRYNVIIITIKRHNGDMVFNPSAQEVIRPWDTLLVVASKAEVDNLRSIM